VEDGANAARNCWVMRYTAERLLVRPAIRGDAAGVLTRVTARDAGWDLLNMEVRRLARGETWTHDTGECETALVLLGGRGAVYFTQRPYAFASRAAAPARAPRRCR